MSSTLLASSKMSCLTLGLKNVFPQNWPRLLSSSSLRHFKFSQLEITECDESEKKKKPDPKSLLFGQTFTDHMFEVEWKEDKGWGTPRISPFHPFTLHPAAKVLHYAQELFEGLKAFRGFDNKIRLFRPDMNMNRMLRSARRLSLPDFDPNEMAKCLKKLVEIDSDWIPGAETMASLYIRPTFIGIEPTLGVAAAKHCLLFIILSPVGAYFATGVKPVSLLADPKLVRAWPGGCGDNKLGSNYAPTVAVQKEAERQGYQQVLWLYGDDHQLTEVGTMNIWLYLINEAGEKELVTPPLDQGIILPGVVRSSLLQMARDWKEVKVSERRIAMAELKKALSEGRVLEMFGSGTACVVCPVGKIAFQGEDLIIPSMDPKEAFSLRFLKELTDMQYGKVTHPWAPVVC